MINTLYRMTKEYATYPLHSVMMFTDAHAHVIQMLEDPSYYKAIDDMTGKDVVIFHTRLFQGRYEMPSPPPGVVCLMVPVWREPQANRQILPLFDMRDSTSLPCLVTFCFADGDVHYTKSEIDRTSPQAAFNAVEAIVQRLVKAANNSDDRLDAMKKATFAMRALNFRKGIGEFLGLLGTFRGATGI
jgi:hypothetical protein